MLTLVFLSLQAWFEPAVDLLQDRVEDVLVFYCPFPSRCLWAVSLGSVAPSGSGCVGSLADLFMTRFLLSVHDCLRSNVL